MEPARRTDHINTYQYGVRDCVWDGVVLDQVEIAARCGNVVRFELGELGESGDSRVGSGIVIEDASSLGHEVSRMHDHKVPLSHRVDLQDRLMSRRVELQDQLVAHVSDKKQEQAHIGSDTGDKKQEHGNI